MFLSLLIVSSSKTTILATATGGVASSQPLLTGINMAADASWEFNDDLEGWAKSTTEEMEAEIYQTGGEMRIQFEGDRPHFDSPIMSLSTGSHETIVLKYRYVGQSTQGLAQISGTPLPFTEVDYNSNSDSKHSLYFYILGDGNWHVAYIPLEASYLITTIRFWPATYRPAGELRKESPAPNGGNSFHIDWIRIIRGPLIRSVTGCYGEMYSNETSFSEKIAQVSQSTISINRFLNYSRTLWERRNTSLTYARTFNCKREGGELITLEGFNFGTADPDAPAFVEIDGLECSNVTHDLNKPEELLTCFTPKMPSISNPETRYSIIQIRNGRLPGLTHEAPFVRYATNPPIPSHVFISNVASRQVEIMKCKVLFLTSFSILTFSKGFFSKNRSFDLNWKPGGSFWQHMTITGYKIQWRQQQKSASWEYSMIVGNITTTSIRSLEPNASYLVGISALCEDQGNDIELDMYGRREHAMTGALRSEVASISARTLETDIKFPYFSANLTQNHSSIYRSATLGPTGNFGGEGHFGLYLIGDASIENCNSSTFCCDSYDPLLGARGSCGVLNSLVCQDVGDSKLFELFTVVADSSPPLQVNLASCGPSLRLTGSHARLKGAAWYRRQMDVGEGFDTNFTFRISNPSVRCINLNGAYDGCRSRGADGLAFVIQGSSADAVGRGGKNIGYGGINNSLVVEFDTYFNYEELDPYDNHVSIHTRGQNFLNSPNQMYSIAHTNHVPDLTDGMINVR
jgi:hypothetical protein